MTACHIRCQTCGFRLKTLVFFNLQKYLGCEPNFLVFLSEINFLTKFCGMDTLWGKKKPTTKLISILWISITSLSLEEEQKTRPDGGLINALPEMPCM